MFIGNTTLCLLNCYVPIKYSMRYLLLTITLLVSAVSVSASSKYYMNYIPIRFDGTHLVVAQDLYTKEHFDRVEFVLEFNFRKYIRSYDTEIDLTEPMDREFMWNMTTKAEDSEWMERQRKLWKKLEDKDQ